MVVSTDLHPSHTGSKKATLTLLKHKSHTDCVTLECNLHTDILSVHVGSRKTTLMLHPFNKTWGTIILNRLDLFKM